MQLKPQVKSPKLTYAVLILGLVLMAVMVFLDRQQETIESSDNVTATQPAHLDKSPLPEATQAEEQNDELVTTRKYTVSSIPRNAYNVRTPIHPRDIKPDDNPVGQLPIRLSHVKSSIPEQPVEEPETTEQPEEPSNPEQPNTIFGEQSSNQRGQQAALTSEEAKETAFAPYGRPIPCKLVNTVDSISNESPIIALTTKDLYWNNKLIIPAGSEIHGYANTNSRFERLEAQSDWRVILPQMDKYPAGRELRLKGVALNRDASPDNLRFSFNDMAFGLIGDTIRSDNIKEIQVFVATALGAFAGGLQNQEEVGTTGVAVVENNARNAALGGLAAVMDTYAQLILNRIEQEGFYTRVPAGREFYLYVQQSIFLEMADIPVPPSIANHQEFELWDAQRQSQIDRVSPNNNPINIMQSRPIR